VASTAGQVEVGSHVVVTVPLGVLKAGRPEFMPPLPADRLAAIERLGFGWFEKVVLRFEEPFWRAAGFPHLMLFPRDPAESTIWIIGLDAFGDGPTLGCFIFHGFAERTLDASTDAAATVLGLLDDVIGRPCPQPVAVAVSNWARDPYSLGSYSHIPPGATPADADLLGEPLHGRLLFAGEHTQSRRLVYTDGAMASGIREAKRILHQSQVVLETPG
jgi:polyamine oxidase